MTIPNGFRSIKSYTAVTLLKPVEVKGRKTALTDPKPINLALKK